MTEAEWRACDDPNRMLESLAGLLAPRRVRLFAAACCRRVRDALADEAGRDAVAVAERFADGRATAEELGRAGDAVCERHDGLEEWLDRADVYSPEGVRLFNAVEAAWRTAVSDFRFGLGVCENADWAKERDGAEYPAQAALLRCIFGNPFRPVSLPTACRTPAVVALARAAYDERRLPSGELHADRLAVLADAREDAGAAGDILTHLRGPGPHVRGCWALDLALGLS